MDKYERSKTYAESNTVVQNFSVNPEDLFPGYSDPANYELFQNINASITELTDAGLVTIKAKKGGVVTSVLLVKEKNQEIYRALHRTPKRDIQIQQKELLQTYIGYHDLLDRYCIDQITRLEENKPIRAFDSFSSFESVLKVLSVIHFVEEETYQRDFSARVLGDSKAFEKIRKKVISILMEYGDFADEETVLEDLNIVKNPGHVFLKGKATLNLSGQTVNLGKFEGDIALSSMLLKQLDDVQVTGSRVITVENLTTFHSFSDDNALIIYLGGYHNAIRRDFIRKVYERNPDLCYCHYGDIDAGGFYILQHLKRKTGITFQPLHMDIQTLSSHKNAWKPLTENDRRRLKNLTQSEFADTVNYMLENGCKLEQESLD